ncbi:D-galactarate dehydratase [Actinobacteria bacterium YIM 96077]|uniref:D-galactarate dehydratase n=1 Tax=Phytoactinopolyspora halophila TaxID=1981511 RepID=A0A329QBU9_9ACTN|nr:UxaA family hydrolase [Phytoactinopolyspora halophila]AYY11822.1 D-galactarate dehydratase [Actinobacteria bacterium YIM 96077]RAW09843.1 D-galactarate dehydratase [Phytoactinopolyspora halophila]
MLNADAPHTAATPDPARADARALLLNADDNVATMMSPASAGDRVAVESEGDPGAVIIVADDVAVGHKIALTDLASGEEIRKYGGEVIGVASQDIRSGEHVHEHNVRGIEPGGQT